MLIYSSLFSLIQRFLCLIFSSRWFDGSIWEYLTVVHPIINPLFPYRAQFNSIHFISPFLPIFSFSFSFYVFFPIFPLFPRNLFEQFFIFFMMVHFPFFLLPFTLYISLHFLPSFNIFTPFFSLYSFRNFLLFFTFLVILF